MYGLVVIFLLSFGIQSHASNCSPGHLAAKIVPCVGLEWTSSGARYNQNSPFLVTLINDDGSPSRVVDLDVKVELWMDMGGHGHGSKPTTTTYFVNSSVAYVDQVWFVMKGDWQVRVKLKVPESETSDAQEEEVVFTEIIQK